MTLKTLYSYRSICSSILSASASPPESPDSTSRGTLPFILPCYRLEYCKAPSLSAWKSKYTPTISPVIGFFHQKSTAAPPRHPPPPSVPSSPTPLLRIPARDPAFLFFKCCFRSAASAIPTLSAVAPGTDEFRTASAARCGSLDCSSFRQAMEGHFGSQGVAPAPSRRLSSISAHLQPEKLAMADSAFFDALSLAPTAGSQSVFEGVQQAPEDPILGVTVAYNNDPSPVKLNLGVGAYRTEEGKPVVLDVVRRAEERLLSDKFRNKEYLPITGLAQFNKLSAKLILGADSPAIQENRVATVQCLSGTGSLRVGAEFLAKHYYQKVIYIPVPTWGNHLKIFPLGGVAAQSYRYYDPRTKGLDYEGLLEDLNRAPAGAIVLLHACAHNPTGVDPTKEQWEGIRQLVRKKGLLPFFDSAYQGFASGSLDADAQPIRTFVADGGELLVAQSFAKNLGLYGERVGALSVVVRGEAVAKRVESQLKLVIRPMYSNPPTHGAAIVATVLGDRDLFQDWTVELKAMADRIISMRHQLFDALKVRGTPGDWTHILKQIGMFTFTGLDREQVEFMTREYHVYMTFDGRISMAGLSSKTVAHLADAIHAAVTRRA